MTTQNNKKTNFFDVAIIGAGPSGIAFDCTLSKFKIKVVILDKNHQKILENPKIDGREVAITHQSAEILKNIKVWQNIPNKFISTIKEARVLNGESSYFLNFNHEEIQKKNLGYLIPNHVIKKFLYKRLKKISNVKLISGVECLSINTKYEKYSTIELSNGKKINASLIVASDSRFSKSRAMMGISAITRNFNKNMIVCRMKHEKPHNNIAYEFFRYSQTQA